jgi:hypothetical protein
MDNNELQLKLNELERSVADMTRLFEDHNHDGIGTNRIKYGSIKEVPTTTVNDSDVVFTDITTNDVSTTKHGYVPKAPNDSTKFLRGDATWVGLTMVATDVLKSSADTQRDSGGDSNNTYTKKKEITIGATGSIRVKFELESSTSLYFAYGKVYKNGSPIGTERSTKGVEIFSEDFSGIIPTDKIQLYIHNYNDGGSGNTARCRNFRIYYDFVASPTVDID